VSDAWVWIDPRVLLAVHDEQLAEHGGARGTRDLGLFESALARPRNLARYGAPDAADVAAAYGAGIARNHPFIDGNKRTAFVAVELLLALNGQTLVASDAACVLTLLGVADGTLDEAAFARWLRSNTRPRGI
jgi:death-on-curing protein